MNDHLDLDPSRRRSEVGWTDRPVHEAQLTTYLRLSGHRLGLIMNFNCGMLKDGIRRRRIPDLVGT